jgi:3-hydroxyisobutyrate dehydrogenase-like beta-hydroxyacid dehydrogenase
MGASLGGALSAAGIEVLWASEGRSPASRERARRAHLVDVGTLADLAARSQVILSVCPPSEALAVARRVATIGFGGIYVDANAVAPATARVIRSELEAVGAVVVDGDLIGGPVKDGTGPRMYLSGEAAGRVAGLFDSTAVTTVVLAGGQEAASALKMCYAAYTKGAAALLLAIRALAAHEGVDDALVAEWSISQPDLVGRSDLAAKFNSAKAWRFAGEMEQIAAAFASAELPAGFGTAAAEVYRRLSDFKDRAEPPTLDDVVSRLLDPL